jgi:hypothetical protein
MAQRGNHKTGRFRGNFVVNETISLFTVMDIDTLLISESGRISEDIHQRSLNTSVWLDLITKDTWPDEMGQTISVMTYEPTTPLTASSWDTIAFNDGDGNTCVPTAAQIEFAQTVRTYNLQRTALESPKVCVDDLRYSFKRKKQLESCFSVLTQNTQRLWEYRHRDEYVRLAQHKIIVTDGFPEDPTAFPTTVPTGRLSAGVLKKYYLKLLRQNAARDGGSVDMEDGQPNFIAIMSPESDEAIITEDYQIREDFRNTARGPELLRALGINRSYKGFYHLIDHEAPRWNFTGGAWVRVPYYIKVATTKGNMDVENPAYETALYEDTIIFLPSVMKSLVPKPISTPGGNTEFEPQKYMGDWKWKNIEDRVENPDKSWGYFRGLFASGSEPIFPQFGYVLRHLRANVSNDLVDANGDLVA